MEDFIRIAKTKDDGFIAQLTEAIKKHDRELNKLTASFFTRHAAKGTKVPRLGGERAKALWELVASQPQ